MSQSTEGSFCSCCGADVHKADYAYNNLLFCTERCAYRFRIKELAAYARSLQAEAKRLHDENAVLRHQQFTAQLPVTRDTVNIRRRSS